MAVSNRAVFIDKDGTLVRDVPYNADPARIELMPGAAVGLRAFAGAAYRIVVVSNQSGVARGLFPESALADMDARLRELVRQGAGADLDGFYYCPHHPLGAVRRYAFACACRKPLPGLLQHAASRHDIDLAQSWMIGDILDDVEAGRRAGCQTVLLDNGHETQWRVSRLRTPHFVADDLAQAAQLVLAMGVAA